METKEIYVIERSKYPYRGVAFLQFDSETENKQDAINRARLLVSHYKYRFAVVTEKKTERNVYSAILNSDGSVYQSHND